MQRKWLIASIGILMALIGAVLGGFYNTLLAKGFNSTLPTVLLICVGLGLVIVALCIDSDNE